MVRVTLGLESGLGGGGVYGGFCSGGGIIVHRVLCVIDPAQWSDRQSFDCVMSNVAH